MGDNSLEARMEGGTGTTLQDQEAARLGLKRTPDDIPKQGKPPATGFKSSAVNPAHFWPSTTETGGHYQIGPARRPNIVHDRGFLVFPRRAPGAEDYTQLAVWRGMLEGAEALRPDLSDALGAYRHFLNGNGRTRMINYDRYVTSDASGRITMRNAILEFQHVATEIALNHPELTGFQMTGPAIMCGADATSWPIQARQFPYPATENWQKAIGGHAIWLSGSVQFTANAKSSLPDVFRATMDLHAEDRYNFNPDNEDITTGIPDSANGRFEVTGLGHQYENHATLRRILTWKGLELGVTSATQPDSSRARQSGDNYRLRNRI